MAESRSDLDIVIEQLTNDLNNLKTSIPAPLDPNAPTKINYTSTVPSGKINVFDPNSPALFVQSSVTSTRQGSGVSLGNAGGWTTGTSMYREHNSFIRGIDQVYSVITNKYGTGDHALVYGYQRTSGGKSAASDEGVTNITLQQTEHEQYFHGTVVATSGKGDQHPSLLFTSGNRNTSDGSYLLNVTKSVASGNVIAPSQPFVPFAGEPASFLNFMPVTPGSMPLTTACGYVATAINNSGVTADSPVSYTFTARIVPIQGKLELFAVGDTVLIAGDICSEQSKILVAVDQGNGMQTLTMLLKYPNNFAFIFRGGLAGTYISFGANLRFTTAAGTPMRSSYPAVGSMTGNDIIYVLNVEGGVARNLLPQIGSEAAKNDGGPDSDFECFAGAEIVRNAPGAICMLEQNNVDWTNAIVENPHYPVFGGTNAFLTKSQITPSNSSAGSGFGGMWIGKGTGFGGGNVFMHRSINQNPPQWYQGCKDVNGKEGPIVAPMGNELMGPFFTSYYIERSHAPGGSTVEVQAPFDPNNPTAPVHSLNYNWCPGGNLRLFPGNNPLESRWQFDAPLNCDAGLLVHGQAGVQNDTLKLADGRTAIVQGGIIIKIE